MSPFTILILIAIAAGAFGYIDEETELNFDDELSSSEDLFGRIGELDGKIVGGADARPGQFPHQVSLRSYLYGHICGASILNRLFVLTAARCTQGGDADPARIHLIVGALRRGNDGIRHQVHSVYIHPEYSAVNRINDISIIRTVNDILFDTPNVRPVRLPISDVPEAGNLSVYVSGWGRTSHPGSPAAILQFVDAVTLNRQECIARHGPVKGRYVYENTLCVHNPVGRGACMGDYGGALITPRGVQVGIVSWVRACALGLPDVYANVWSHIAWIKATIRSNWNPTQLE